MRQRVSVYKLFGLPDRPDEAHVSPSIEAAQCAEEARRFSGDWDLGKRGSRRPANMRIPGR